MNLLQEHNGPPSLYARSRLWLVSRRPVVLAIGFIVLWCFAYLAPSIFIPVRPGQVGVLWRYFGDGTDTETTFGEGLRLIWPWDDLYLYDTRYQQITHNVGVLSRDGLQYQIDATVRYRIRPEKAGLLHKTIGPDYVETLILPLVASRIRSEVARHNADEVYTNRVEVESALGEKIRSPHPDLQEPYEFIDIRDVFIRNVVLPAAVAQAIEAKLVQKQQALEYVYRLEKEEKEKLRKEIEAEGIRRFQEIFDKNASEAYLRWVGIAATLELAKSNNAKVVVIGRNEGGLPIILGEGPSQPTPPEARPSGVSGVERPQDLRP